MSRKMKILVLYYSGTGNTRFACDVARAVMEKAGHEVTMRTYQKAGAVQYDDFDAFCFAAPVYEWAPAKNVERFVDAMPRIEGKCAFLLTSSAGAQEEGAHGSGRPQPHLSGLVGRDPALVALC